MAEHSRTQNTAEHSTQLVVVAVVVVRHAEHVWCRRGRRRRRGRRASRRFRVVVVIVVRHADSAWC